MTPRPSSLLQLALSLCLCGGCFGNTSVKQGPPEETQETDQLLLDRVPAVSGAKDVDNRYLPTIQVIVKEKKDAEKARDLLRGLVSPSGNCSGVLIHPRLVLTAGHCVCMMRPFTAAAVERATEGARQRTRSQPGAVISRSAALKDEAVAAIIDSSECAKTARIRTLTYEKSTSGKEKQSQIFYDGTVWPHPRMELLFNEKARQVWATADLAVLKLDEPVSDLTVFKLGSSEVQPGEPIVMVGYGPADDDDDTFGERHSGANTVGWLRRMETGSVEFVAEAQRQSDGSPTSHIFGGDSGGACLKQRDQNVLVGIAASTARNRKGEALSIFTSVYAHRDWLTQQLDAL
jgi:hypothetical protein